MTGVCSGAWADDSGRGDDHGQMRRDEQLVLKKTIDVGGIGLGAFDISFVDPKIELYVLADRTNASVDLFDSEDATFIGRVGGFKGVVLAADGKTADNTLSGPDGVVIVDGKEIWAGDGDSTVKVIDIGTRSIINTISSGGTNRVDEMAYDSRDHILAAANNADVPPFVTLFDTTAKSKMGRITFDGTNNTPPATKTGIEQPQWSPGTGLFYVSVPDFTTVDPNDSTTPGVGGVAVIDPNASAGHQVLRTLLVKNCNPAGLALGPRHQALIGCSGNFVNSSGEKTTQSLIIDITSKSDAVDGAVIATVPIGGNDEVWFDKGTRHYFLAARNNLTAGKADPILGSIDAGTNKLDPSAPTSLTAHSVAADANAHNVFVPIGCASSKADSCTKDAPKTTDPTNTDPDCRAQGCIAVFRARSEHSDEKVSER